MICANVSMFNLIYMYSYLLDTLEMLYAVKQNCGTRPNSFVPSPFFLDSLAYLLPVAFQSISLSPQGAHEIKGVSLI